MSPIIRRAPLVFVALLSLAASASAQSIRWRRDYETGLKEAKASKRLAMIDFYADW